MLFAAPLPADTKHEDLSASPPPATGPYEIVASRGRFVGIPSQSGVGEDERRVAAADPRRPLRHDRHGVVLNAETAVNEVERGRIDWMQEPPPPDRYEELKDRYEGTQFITTPQIDIYYFWMNVRRRRSTTPRVRRAVNYAIAPEALQRIYCPRCGRTSRCFHRRCPATASTGPTHTTCEGERLIAAADPKMRKTTFWTDDYPPNKQAGEYYEGVLLELGSEPTLKVMPSSQLHDDHRQRIDPEPRYRLGQLVPRLSASQRLLPAAAVHRASPRHQAPTGPASTTRQPTGKSKCWPHPARTGRGSRLRTSRPQVLRQAPWAPFGSASLATFVSDRIDLGKLIVSPVYGQDLTSFAPSWQEHEHSPDLSRRPRSPGKIGHRGEDDRAGVEEHPRRPAARFRPVAEHPASRRRPRRRRRRGCPRPRCSAPARRPSVPRRRRRCGSGFATDVLGGEDLRPGEALVQPGQPERQRHLLVAAAGGDAGRQGDLRSTAPTIPGTGRSSRRNAASTSASSSSAQPSCSGLPSHSSSPRRVAGIPIPRNPRTQSSSVIRQPERPALAPPGCDRDLAAVDQHPSQSKISSPAAPNPFDAGSSDSTSAASTIYITTQKPALGRTRAMVQALGRGSIG